MVVSSLGLDEHRSPLRGQAVGEQEGDYALHSKDKVSRDEDDLSSILKSLPPSYFRPSSAKAGQDASQVGYQISSISLFPHSSPPPLFFSLSLSLSFFCPSSSSNPFSCTMLSFCTVSVSVYNPFDSFFFFFLLSPCRDLLLQAISQSSLSSLSWISQAPLLGSLQMEIAPTSIRLEDRLRFCPLKLVLTWKIFLFKAKATDLERRTLG